jgi:hypothetical protein
LGTFRSFSRGADFAAVRPPCVLHRSYVRTQGETTANEKRANQRQGKIRKHWDKDQIKLGD